MTDCSPTFSVMRTRVISCGTKPAVQDARLQASSSALSDGRREARQRGRAGAAHHRCVTGGTRKRKRVAHTVQGVDGDESKSGSLGILRLGKTVSKKDRSGERLDEIGRNHCVNAALGHVGLRSRRSNNATGYSHEDQPQAGATSAVVCRARSSFSDWAVAVEVPRGALALPPPSVAPSPSGSALCFVG